MGLEQTRPYELGVYDQGLDPATVSIAVDHPAFDRPKRLPLSMFDTTGMHIEKDIITGLSSHSISVEFDLPFAVAPIGEVKVYRMVALSNGTFRKEDVIWGFTDINQPTIDGFSLLINSEDEPSLTGIKIEYIYQ